MSPSPKSLKQRRLDAGLTREELARLARVSVPTAQILEGGYRPHRSEALKRIEAVLATYETDPPTEGAQ